MKWPFRKKEEPIVNDRPAILEFWPTFGSDKCDVCPSPAKVRVFIPHTAQVLDFCGHHFRKNEKKFEDLGYLWVDGRTEKEKFSRTLQDISGNL